MVWRAHKGQHVSRGGQQVVPRPRRQQQLHQAHVLHRNGAHERAPASLRAAAAAAGGMTTTTAKAALAGNRLDTTYM